MRWSLEKTPGKVAQNFKDFDIKSSSDRREIAQKCAEKAPWSVVKYIANFDLSDTDVFEEVVEKCLQENKFLCMENSPLSVQLGFDAAISAED